MLSQTVELWELRLSVYRACVSKLALYASHLSTLTKANTGQTAYDASSVQCK